MAFQPIDFDGLLALWRSLFPAGYTVPIENEGDGQGFDVFTQQARQFARVAAAENITTQAYYLRPHSTQTAPESAGERRAVGTLEVRRAPPATGAVTLVAGVEFVADVRSPDGTVLDGVRLRVLADTLIPAGTLGTVPVPVEAVRPGYQGNLPAGSVTRFALRGRATVPVATVEAGNVLRDSGLPDRLTPAMIGQYVRLVGGLNGGTVPRRILSVSQGSPTSTAVLDGAPLTFPDTLTQAEVEEFADIGLTVEQLTPLTGGRHGWLDAIAADRSAGREPGESDDALRLRLSFLDDIVSPAAILRIASRILTPLGIPFALWETRDTFGGLVGFIYDDDPYDAFTLFDVGHPVYLSENSATTFFILAVAFGNAGEFGFAYDAPYPQNAYDATTPLALNFYDGSPLEYLSALASLYAAIDRARAAGVGWLLVRDPTL